MGSFSTDDSQSIPTKTVFVDDVMKAVDCFLLNVESHTDSPKLRRIRTESHQNVVAELSLGYTR